MRKRKLTEAADTARNIAGAALGAAAIAATGVVITRVASAIQQGGKKLKDATPMLQEKAAKTVATPLLPTRKRRAASRKTRAAKASAGRGRAAKRAPAKRRAARRKAGR